ncbi:MAG: type IV pili methyl-accepting chemotaxis transducer N-terminal domain-containing protein [Betaproteobacteria bacterium]|nr:type IV pili methyl-accepting chemotaxis transducer N-terminal domain-containing protein [Betaproteobacteria bacterium]
MAIELKLPGWLSGKAGADPVAPETGDAGTSETGRASLAGATIMEDLRRAPRGGGQSTRLPVIGDMPIAKQFQVLAIGLVAFFVLAALMALVSGRLGAQNAAATGAATEMQMLSQRLARGSALTSIGNKEGFKQVKEAREAFRSNIDALIKGGAVRGVDVSASSDAAVQEILGDIAQRWDKIEQNSGTLLANESSITALSAGVEAINQGNPVLLELTEQGATLLQQAGASTRDLGYANQLVMLTQRIAKNANTLTAGDEIDPEVSFLLGKDVGTFRDIVNGFLSGSEALRISAQREGDARQTYQQIKQRFADYEARVNAILQNMQKLVAAKQAARSVNVESEPLLEKTRALADAYSGAGRGQNIASALAVVFALLALACLAVLGKVFLDDARSRAFDSEHENRRNQEAILRLLNEMGTLADGDLTVKASVTEDVTGAIADSINFTVEELRNVVVGINSSTEQVSKATAETQAISNRLFEASQRQSREIQQASASVLQMAQSINEVSLSAAQSARVAQQSLAAAEKGAVAVQNQISGMNDIRGQIQETSKRIKRLGESSLEIGEIVELISDITEQTNVLALNAAIQAASAGEAGRGFTVVAEEVQRLAERSGEATKQIEAIVKTIQADTQDAVAAMDKSTQGVVDGAKLSDSAGQALQEIERISRELAELIQGISAQTQKQSSSVSDVTRGMQGILKITEETTEGTKQTNVSISQLAKLAQDLRASVAGFKV